LLAMLLHEHHLLVLICLYNTLAHTARSTLPNDILTCSRTRRCRPTPGNLLGRPTNLPLEGLLT
jgi:hypothetical protein